ncbi:MDR family MFS transporter [Ornithinibacillus halophilus]|uniref:Predicted arabinose efflux permease, MFS family n=1 Tax=Ornithinibacillus halophilus TaxID=930117 RepID=A0A1M5FEZ1_9BACI|nr:MFS transporter [Ornithinibacillus halophilus]SHF90009.1 Predicted arabinose efflux permease, MFS family [Ornithinibacillus halophilus]
MPKKIWLLVIAMTINVTGASFLWPLNTIYMHNELGKSLAFAGVILMLNQGAAIIGNLIGGTLFDKFSAYKTILFGIFLSLVAAIILSFNHSILPYSILLVVIGFGSGITGPVMFAMAGSVWPEGGRRAFNAVYVAQNLGVALGATIGGFVASISFDYIFIANAAFFLLFFLVVLFTFKQMDQDRDQQMHTTVLAQSKKIQNKAAFTALIILSSGFFITWLAYSQWQSTIASHTQDLGIPLEQYSTLWAINGFLIVLLQPLVKWVTEKVTSVKKHIYIGTFIFIGSFVVAMYAEEFTMFAVAMVILTIGEILVWPAIPTLANELAPKGRVGFYQGFVNSVAAAGRMMGPVVGGFVVDLFNIQLLFFILLILLVIPFITTLIFDRGVKQQQELAQAN